MSKVGSSLTRAALAGMIGSEPEHLGKLVAAMREDYAVGLAERTFRTTVKQADVTVTASDSTFARANVTAEKLEALFWQKINAMLECVAFGRVAFEKEWKYNAALNLQYIDALNELPYEYTEMRLTEDGKFDGINLKPCGKRKDPLPLDADHSWWLALDPTPLNPHGQSRYTGAPERVWRDRKENFRLLSVFIKRFVLGGGIVHGPDTVDDPDRPGEMMNGVDAFAPHYEALLAAGVLYVSNQREPGKDGAPGEYVWNVEKLETEVRDGRPLLDIIAASDAWMLLAFGFPPKTILEGDAVGSFALVSMQMLLLWGVADEIVLQLVDSYQQYVVDKVAERNGLTGIEVQYIPLTERPDDLANELLKAWLTSPQLSPLVAAVDLQSIFEAVGVPVSDAGLAKLQAIQAALAAVQATTPDPAVQVRAREPAPVEMAADTGRSFMDVLWPKVTSERPASAA